MDVLEKGMICLMKSAITGEELSLPEGFNIEVAVDCIKKHSLIPLIYVGALNCKIDKNIPVMQFMFKEYCWQLLYNEKQMTEVNRIYEAFDKNGIDYMPVKGCNIKNLYPNQEMRPMSDADILIKKDQYADAERVMQEIGFKFEREGDHDLSWNSDNLHVELHHMLILNYNNAYEQYFGSGWNLAYKSCNHRWFMRPEDEFVYLFIHFTKHYRIGGVGCRHVLDLWVYLKSHPKLDMDYISSVMRNLSVSEFYNNIISLIDYWFINKDGVTGTDTLHNDKIEFISDFIMASGNWGTYENKIKAMGVMNAQISGSVKKGRVQAIRKAFFPDLADLRMRYGILKKIPVLLPVMWVYRWFDAAIHRRHNVKSLTNEVKGICTKDFSDFEESLRYVGLDFVFKQE